MRRCGIMGGTFDPVHNAHLEFARLAASQLNLDLVSFIPAGIPNFKRKKQLTPIAQRLAMLRLALAQTASIQNTDFFIDEREAVSERIAYSSQTMEAICAEHPRDIFYFLLGSDVAVKLPLWHDIDRLTKLCSFACIERSGTSFEVVEQVCQAAPQKFNITYISANIPDISSTVIRARVREHKSIDAFVPSTVARYIQVHKLYLS